ncbi:Hsp20/alpha crystallin family protein [Paraburkholderia terrae]
MQTDLQKWNPFRLLRKSGDRTGADIYGKQPAAVGARADRADVLWQLSAGPWRMMHEFLHDPYAGSGAFDRRFGDFTPTHFQPHVDVVDDGDALRVTAELAGMGREDLHATIGNGMLVLRGEKKQDTRSEEKGCYRLERAYGVFLRTIPLPEDIDADRVDAKFERGVLTLRLPETGATRSSARRIEIG